MTVQDVVLVFITVSGHKAEKLVQESYSRKVYHGQVGTLDLAAIQITTAAALCAVVDLQRTVDIARAFREVPEAQIFALAPPAVPGMGAVGGLEHDISAGYLGRQVQPSGQAGTIRGGAIEPGEPRDRRQRGLVVTVRELGAREPLERTVAWICGIHHIRETIPFPRTIKRVYP